jgi:hypothetical protein
MEQDTQLKHSQELVQQFRLTASPNIQQLAEFLALVPVSRSMIRFIQADILHDPMPSTWAEMALGDLLCPLEIDKPIDDRDQREFIPGVQEALLSLIPVEILQTMVEDVAEAIIWQLPEEFSYCIFETMQQYFGQSCGYFEVFLLPTIAWRNDWLRSQMLPFTQAATKLAHDLGGHYQEVADRFTQSTSLAGVEQ